VRANEVVKLGKTVLGLLSAVLLVVIVASAWIGQGIKRVINAYPDIDNLSIIGMEKPFSGHWSNEIHH